MTEENRWPTAEEYWRELNEAPPAQRLAMLELALEGLQAKADRVAREPRPHIGRKWVPLNEDSTASLAGLLNDSSRAWRELPGSDDAERAVKAVIDLGWFAED